MTTKEEEFAKAKILVDEYTQKLSEWKAVLDKLEEESIDSKELLDVLEWLLNFETRWYHPGKGELDAVVKVTVPDKVIRVIHNMGPANIFRTYLKAIHTTWTSAKLAWAAIGGTARRDFHADDDGPEILRRKSAVKQAGDSFPPGNILLLMKKLSIKLEVVCYDNNAVIFRDTF